MVMWMLLPVPVVSYIVIAGGMYIAMVVVLILIVSCGLIYATVLYMISRLRSGRTHRRYFTDLLSWQSVC